MAFTPFTTKFIKNEVIKAYTPGHPLYERFRGFIVQSVLSQVHKAYKQRSHQGPDKFGYRWKRISPYTSKRKTNPENRFRIMVDTGRLMASLEPSITVTETGYKKSNTDQHIRINGASITIGTKVHYADKHDGTGLSTDLRKPIPKREIFPRNMNQIINVAIGVATKKIKPFFQQYLNQKVKELGTKGAFKKQRRRNRR